jgi:NAD(P)-dependent dehydrogenase (short-subunit alcohol dehydrogenase family)
MITGANAGIGKQTALELAGLGAHVVLVARSEERGQAACQEIINQTGNKLVDLLVADLSSQAAIRSMVDTFKNRYDRLDVLVNNAGVFFSNRQVSVDGLEMTFALNHLGYFLPTILLWDVIAAGGPVRIVNVSSDAHRGAKINFDDLQCEKRYQGFTAYGMSKLANVLFTYELDRRRQGTNVTVNALHPGFVASNFGQNNGGMVGFFMKRIVPWFGRSVAEGAATSVYLASSPDVEGISGKYFTDSKPVQSSPESYNVETARRLWEISEQLTHTNFPTLAVPA